MTKSEALLVAMRAKPDYSGRPLREKPAFEFVTGRGDWVAIFADGRIEGVDKADGLYVINRIPMMINLGPGA